MVTLELYKVTNQTNELTKTLNNAVVVDGAFRGEIDSIDVVVEIESNTYDFNYLLSSKDICSINEIRLTLNQIVRDIEDIDKVRMLGSKVITQLESFVNKNWIKIIKYQ